MAAGGRGGGGGGISGLLVRRWYFWYSVISAFFWWSVGLYLARRILSSHTSKCFECFTAAGQPHSTNGAQQSAATAVTFKPCVNVQVLVPLCNWNFTCFTCSTVLELAAEQWPDTGQQNMGAVNASDVTIATYYASNSNIIGNDHYLRTIQYQVITWEPRSKSMLPW